MKTQDTTDGRQKLDTLAAAVDRKIDARGWLSFPCPAHGSRTDKLGVRVGDDGGLIAKCISAGCDWDAICDAVLDRYGVSLRRHIAAGARPRPTPPPIQRWEYQHNGGKRKPKFACRQDWPGRCDKTPGKCAVGGADRPHKEIWQQPPNRKGERNDGYRVLLHPPPDAGPDALPGPADAVVLAEGEKAAGAIAAAGRWAASWLGGTGNVAHADYAPLGGRMVVCWPDADDAGRKAMDTAARLALAAGAAGLRLVEIPQGYPDGWDAADANAETIRRMVDAAVDYPPPDAEPDTPPDTAQGVRMNNAEVLLELTPSSDAIRLITAHAHALLVVWDADGHAEVLLDNGYGVWRRDTDRLRDMMATATEEWCANALPGAANGRITPESAARIARYAQHGRSPAAWRDCLESAGKAVHELRRLDRLPAGLTECNARDLDPTQYLGSANGVIDLRTGRRLPAAEGRRTLTTRSTPDAYDPDARHPDVDRLLAHLPDTERRWLLAGLGYALRGLPNRRMYALAGAPGGGKSTLAGAVLAALGDVVGGGYGVLLPPESVAKSRHTNKGGAQPHAVGLMHGRIAVVAELSDAPLDIAHMKAVSGGDPANPRELRQAPPALRPYRATPVVCLNMGALSLLDTSDVAFARRLRILPYPELPAGAMLGADYADRLRYDPECRRAMLAMLINAGVGLAGPPDDTPTIAETAARQRQESMGDVGDWVLENLAVTEKDIDRLPAAEIWAMLAQDLGADPADEFIGGVRRRNLLKLARSITGRLITPKKVSVSGAAQNCWIGVRWSDAPPQPELLDAETAAETETSTPQHAPYAPDTAALDAAYDRVYQHAAADGAAHAPADALAAMTAHAYGHGYAARFTAPDGACLCRVTGCCPGCAGPLAPDGPDAGMTLCFTCGRIDGAARHGRLPTPPVLAWRPGETETEVEIAIWPVLPEGECARCAGPPTGAELTPDGLCGYCAAGLPRPGYTDAPDTAQQPLIDLPAETTPAAH